MHSNSAIAHSPVRDRIIIGTAIVAITVVAWAYVVRLAGSMNAMGMSGTGDRAMAMAQPGVQAWGAADVALTFAMWAVMMVAMMTPTAAPMLLTFDRLTRRAPARSAAIPASTAFLGGYIVVWSAFSAAATLLQWGFHAAGLLAAGYARVTPFVGGILLVLAGSYQFTPFKDVCLSRCRAPADFLMTEWRDGTRGALAMGMRHGIYCVGCCWVLMLGLFVAGVMNLAWVALIAIYVLIEKALPLGRRVARPMGLLLAAFGIWLLLGSLLA